MPLRTVFPVMISLLLVILTATAQAGEKPVLLFDRGHGERFTTGDSGPLQLSALADVFRKTGFQVRELEAPCSDASLEGAAALVISGPFTPFSPEEAEAVSRFLQRGGKAAVMLHISPPTGSLISVLGVGATATVIHEQQHILDGVDTDFRVTTLEPHPLTAGLSEFAVHGGWGVVNRNDSAAVIARTSSSSWLDLDGDRVLTEKDRVRSFGIAVAGSLGKGSFTVFGDDAIFQNKFLKDGNLQLAENLAAWLKP